MNKKLVIVADGARAQILMAKGRKLHEVLEKKKNEDLNTHSANGVKDSFNSGGHFYDAPTDPKDHEKALFAKSLSHDIDVMLRDDHYDSLILVAPPQMLGLLRKQINGGIPIDRSLCIDATRMNIQQLEYRIFN